MFCKKCGAEIMDDAVICVKCGSPTDNFTNTKKKSYDLRLRDANEPANGGLIILSILIPIVGIIMGIVNLAKGKTRSGKAYLIAGIVSFVVYLIIIVSINARMAQMNSIRMQEEHDLNRLRNLNH